MAINVADNFSYKGGKPLDARTKYSTVADMVATPAADLYDGCLAYVTGTKKNYQYDSSNDTDPTLGKWRELQTGGGGGSSDLRYNVLDYGLKNDKYSDNTTALRNLIDTIPNGSILFFPVGTYMISGGISIDKDVTFIGENEEMQSGNTAPSRNHDPMSIIKYGGTEPNVTLFTRAQGYFDINFVNLTFDGGDSYNVTDNWTGTVEAPTYGVATPASGSNPKANYWYEEEDGEYTLTNDTTVQSGKTYYYLTLPFHNLVETVRQVTNVALEGINGLDLFGVGEAISYPGIVKNCMFWGFSGYGVKVRPHKYIERCGFYKCKKGIETTWSDSLLHDLWFCKCGTAIYMYPRLDQLNQHHASVNLSDIWADQLIDHFVESDTEVTAAQIIASNLWIDSVGKSAFYLPNAVLSRSRISGTFGRVGLDYAGILDSERTVAKAHDTDFLVCDQIIYSILELNISNVNIIKGVAKDRPCFSRLVKVLKASVNNEHNKIVCNSFPSAKFFDTSMMPQYAHFLDTEFNGTDGDIVYHTNTVKFVNGVFVWNNSPIGRVKAPGPAFFVYDYTAKKLYRSTQGDNVNAWSEVTIDSAYTAGDGIDITNSVISTDNLQEGDMDDIVTPAPQPFGGINLDNIQDVDLSNLTNGQVLKYDSTTQTWKNGEGGGTTINSLGDIADVDLTNLADGQMLQWDDTNSKWVNVNAPSGDTSTCYKTDDSAETTLADDDYIPFYDTSATAKKKSLWSNIKSVLKTYFDSIYDTAPTILTQTLTTGATSVTFNDASITSTAIVDVYTSKAGLNYTSINDSVANTLVITYDAQDSDVVVKLSVR